MLLEQGIPLIDNYQKLANDGLFLEMERFSNDFIGRFASALKAYNWVSDPFHQWSRQWEYPFAYSYLEEYIGDKLKGAMNILDAGSGITFFPYYIISAFNNSSKLICLDSDGSLQQIFKEINSTIDKPVEFIQGDIQQLPFEDNRFNIIYCISVLEHIIDYEPVFSEFYRILKLGGLLVVTFDISLDMDGPMPLNRVDKIIALLESRFQPVAGFDSEKSLSLLKEGSINEILTTEWIKKTNPDLLPWRRQLSLRLTIGHLLKLQIPRNFVNLTCFCEALFKVQG